MEQGKIEKEDWADAGNGIGLPIQNIVNYS